MILYYNCARPVEVLQTRRIHVSKIHGGVSMSTNFQMGSHGPFKIEFRNPRWMKLLKQCLYMTPMYEQLPQNYVNHRFRRTVGYKDQNGKTWTAEEFKALLSARIAKHDMFVDEAEWWSPTEIEFDPDEVHNVYYMTNAPRVQPIVTRRQRRMLRSGYGYVHQNAYQEVQIADPYLQRTVQT